MINYNILSDSIDHYTYLGYARVEVPWTVTKEVSDITRPPFAKEFELSLKTNDNGKVLVASGEQGFLYQYIKGYLPKGKFQTITPCFRYENYDYLHQKFFIKNELINTLDTSAYQLSLMIGDALAFFKKHVVDCGELKVVEIENELSYDIMYKGIELGSYGIRVYNDIKWIYGTGVAEPRFSKIKNL